MYEYMIRVENLSRFKNGIIGTRMNMNHFKCPICIEILKFRAPVYSAQFYLGQKNSKEYKFCKYCTDFLTMSIKNHLLLQIIIIEGDKKSQ
jgi:hypothetical protein